MIILAFLKNEYLEKRNALLSTSSEVLSVIIGRESYCSG